jgi:hypothetical protein
MAYPLDSKRIKRLVDSQDLDGCPISREGQVVTPSYPDCIGNLVRTTTGSYHFQFLSSEILPPGMPSGCHGSFSDCLRFIASYIVYGV